jgi:hypothetical protein
MMASRLFIVMKRALLEQSGSVRIAVFKKALRVSSLSDGVVEIVAESVAYSGAFTVTLTMFDFPRNCPG